MHRALLFLALAATAMSGSGAAAQGREPALIRARASLVVGGHGTTYHERDIFVTTNRSILQAKVTNITQSVTLSFWNPHVQTATATVASYTAFKRALAEHRVGLVQGDCTVQWTTAPARGYYLVTWYGAGTRKNEFKAHLNGTLPLCSDDVAGVLRAITNLTLSAGLEAFALLN